MAPLVYMALQPCAGESFWPCTWEHVDLAAQTAFLPVTKNGSARLVPLSTKAVAILSALDPAAAGPVFHISDMTMEAAFRTACARAGIVNLQFHDLRHTATSRMAEKLTNVIELASVTGHQTTLMLKRYYHPSAEALAKKLG